MKKVVLPLALALCALSSHAEENPAIDAMQEYMAFAEYSEGAISTEQLASIEAGEIFFVDTRNAGEFAKGHIPGAVNIEWRGILERRKEIPQDKPVVLYCEAGLLSSKAHFALKIAGWDNVKVLWGGYLVWSAKQSFENAQAQDAFSGSVSAE